MSRKKPLISMCMIMRDEAENLPRALKSLEGLAGEMIIVDTGSVDGSVEIAKSFGAKVYHLPWNNDFSTPRNLAIEKARGEWILIFDADEEICREDIPKILDCAAMPGLEGFVFSTVNFIGSEVSANRDVNLNLRLVRNRKEYRYEGKIHEHLTNILSNPVMTRKDIRVHHYGYMNPQIANKEKVQRNLNMLLEKFEQEKDKITNFDHFNLGIEYVRSRQWAKALECFEKSSDNLDTNLLWGSSLRRAHLLTLANLGRNEEGIRLADEFIRLYPTYADLIYIKGIMCLQVQKIPEAVGSFHQCLALEGMVPPEYTHDAEVCGYKAHFALGKAYGAAGQHGKAADHFRQSLELNPRPLEVVHDFLTASLMHGGMPGLQEAAEYLGRDDDYDRLLAITESLANLGQKDLALHYLKKAKSCGNDSDFEYYLEALLYSKHYEWDSTLAAIANISKDSPYYKRAKLLEINCYWYQDREDKADELFKSLSLSMKDCADFANVFLQQARNSLALGRLSWPESRIFNDYEQLLNECQKILAGG